MIVYSSNQRLMASRDPSEGPSARPSTTRTASHPHTPKTTAPSSDDRLKVPKRAHTFANATSAKDGTASPDAFDTAEHSDSDDGIETTRASIELDILPIELITLTDSFIESLNAKVHPTPPNIERLSQKFQEFYTQASANINTHINALASRQSRDVSPAPSTSSISSAASRLRSKASALTKAEPEQQMITSEELASRKRTRKALEAKRSLLEEAVERRLLDLTTLRADEQLSGPAKSTSPRTETFPPAYQQGEAPSSANVPETSKTKAEEAKLSAPDVKASVALRNRRLSDLVNGPAQAFGAASDAVFNTADQSLKNISNSLGDSYKFLVGKLREHQDSPRESITVPRTLDDARKLVSTPSPDEEDSSGLNRLLAPDDNDLLKRPASREERVLNLIGGRRDRSADSTRSGRSASSSKKVLFASDEPKTASQIPGQNPAVLDQMRNLGNSFNPMARLPSISMIRGFGRNTPSAPATPAAKEPVKPADGGDLGTAFPDIAPALPPKEIPRIAPPNKRFMEIQTPGELKLGEVLDLLRDYRRLAGALKDIGAFETK
ncbi:hypothetical protein FOC1_g10013621 [Fusarium oxysporum f. sp. cubense race 1]|uniref:Uncharacterized protein n=1 Tax=Fusarium oxysporum f. sp. cubense (strain race 1) TaxID=1229664 RepID=N4U6C5_FUSC1|nr:hypothetical protein FOC1_g10013621 [Fusarium oxysporum f. sp. cubense race 1]